MEVFTECLRPVWAVHRALRPWGIGSKGISKWITLQKVLPNWILSIIIPFKTTSISCLSCWSCQSFWMALPKFHSSTSISQITLFMANTSFRFHPFKGQYWVFTYFNHLIIPTPVRLLPAVAEHPYNNVQYWKTNKSFWISRHNMPDVQLLYSDNSNKTLQPQ